MNPSARQTPGPSRPWVAQARLATPLGPVTVACTAQGLGGLWFDAQRHHPGPLRAPTQASHPILAQTAHWLERYWHDPAAVGCQPPALDLGGTVFQQAVWTVLLQLRPGETTTYQDLARQVGRPVAARAVGAAVGRNPVSLLVPCHRVLGQGGRLTGYAGGLERKAELLRRESTPR